MQTEVAIIGAGPAGLAAAIQLHRYDLKPLLFERERVGGLLHNANLVENYPGFPGGIRGPDLVRLFQQQAERAGVYVKYEEVRSLSHDGQLFRLMTPTRTYSCRIVVVASGTRPRLFSGFPIPPGLDDRVMYEVFPLLKMRGKRVAIVGGGDAAFDYAMNLGRRNQVTVIHRSGQRTCLPLLWERAKALPSIGYWENTALTGLVEDSDRGVTLECLQAGKPLRLSVDFLVVAIGRDPQMEFLADSLVMSREALQSAGRMYMIGDVTNGIYRQTSIAVGQGVQTAMQIYRSLSEDRTQ